MNDDFTAFMSDKYTLVYDEGSRKVSIRATSLSRGEYRLALNPYSLERWMMRDGSSAEIADDERELVKQRVAEWKGARGAPVRWLEQDMTFRQLAAYRAEERRKAVARPDMPISVTMPVGGCGLYAWPLADSDSGNPEFYFRPTDRTYWMMDDPSAKLEQVDRAFIEQSYPTVDPDNVITYGGPAGGHHYESCFRALQPAGASPAAGDLFTAAPADDAYVFGRVVSAEALPLGEAGGPCNLIYIYDVVAAAPELPAPEQLTREHLLLAPLMTNDLPWTRGFFRTIAHRELRAEDRLPVHCFGDWRGRYVDERGNELAGRVEPAGPRKLDTFMTIDIAVCEALGLPVPAPWNENSYDPASDPDIPSPPQVAPFVWRALRWSADQLVAGVGLRPSSGYLAELFSTRLPEGFTGSGYDWTALAQVFVAERLSDVKPYVRFDPEPDRFLASSFNVSSLERFATGFCEACADRALIADLFSRAQPPDVAEWEAHTKSLSGYFIEDMLFGGEE